MDKKEKEDAILSQLVMDLDLFDDFCQAIKERGQFQHPIPAEDELQTGLHWLRKEGTLNVWLVFAARIFLDVQDILGKDVKKGLQEFRHTGKKINNLIDSTGALSDRKSAILWLSKDVLSKDVKVVEQLHETAFYWALEANFSLFRRMAIQDLDLSDPDWGRMGGHQSNNGSSRSNVEAPIARTTENPSAQAITYVEDQQQTAKNTKLNGIKLPSDPSFTKIESLDVQDPCWIQRSQRRSQLEKNA